MGVIVYEKALSDLFCNGWCVSGFLLWECDSCMPGWLILLLGVIIGIGIGYVVTAVMVAYEDFNDIKVGRNRY